MFHITKFLPFKSSAAHIVDSTKSQEIFKSENGLVEVVIDLILSITSIALISAPKQTLSHFQEEWSKITSLKSWMLPGSTPREISDR